MIVIVYFQAITIKNEIEFKAPAKPNFPPPPPPMTAAPPMPPPAPGPPPLPCGPPPPMPKLELPKKNIPRPSNPLKCFNWSKLPDAKLNGTIWTELDETKLYRILDLEDIDREFCSYQKNGINTDGSVEDLRLLPPGKNRSKVIKNLVEKNFLCIF